MMALRDEAKMGLQRMDDMGQMGNSEEAIIPDGVPFGMDDLEIEDDGEPQEFNLGGVVQAPGTGIAGYTPPSMTTTGYTPPPVGTAVAPVVPGSQPQVSFTPATATTNIPTFGQFVGTGGGKYDELVTYVNDAGQIMQIPHVMVSLYILYLKDLKNKLTHRVQHQIVLQQILLQLHHNNHKEKVEIDKIMAVELHCLREKKLQGILLKKLNQVQPLLKIDMLLQETVDLIYLMLFPVVILLSL